MASAQAPPTPLESVRAIDPAERHILDLTGAPQTPLLIASRHPGALVDADEGCVHDLVILGSALLGVAYPGPVLERARAALKPGGRLILELPNRRSFWTIAGLVTNQPATHERPPTPMGATTLAEMRAELLFAGFVDVACRAVLGQGAPAIASFPVRIGEDGLSIVAPTPDDARDLFAVGYVVDARVPLA